YTNLLDPNLFAAVQLKNPSIPWHLVMAWKKNSAHSPAVQAWLQVVREHFQAFHSTKG
ncbi:LysR substrate-binding domain-containing protein, partial [Acinetobacter sp. MD2(2019)]|nr:LysR family transcriptional regulator [Acinetobacter sp. MD2(2019)]